MRKLVIFSLLAVGFLDWAASAVVNRVQLTQGQTDRDGVVMVQENGQWGPACGLGFGTREAVVTCRHLGFDSGDAVCCMPYGTVGWSHHTRHNISCQGNETSLHHCTSNLWNRTAESSTASTSWFWSWLGFDNSEPSQTYCEEHDYAAVVCRSHPAPSQDDFQVSLAGDSSFSGRVKVTYDGVRGGVCGEGWSTKAADRLCKDLGFLHGANYSHAHSDPAMALGPVWTNNVICDNASSFTTCEHAPFGSVESCDHYAAVLCYNDSYSHSNRGYPAYYLDGERKNVGAVRVYVDGQWGSVSSEAGWTRADLDVMCRSLGYSVGKFLSHDVGKTPRSGPVWNLVPGCVGTESDLMHCSVTRGWSLADTQDHSRDLMVACSDSVELRHGSTGHDGMVYIKGSAFSSHSTFYSSLASEDQWMPLCNNNFDSDDARVICRELGFEDGVSLCCGEAFGYFYDFNDNWNAKMAATVSPCNGSESNFRDCASLAYTGDQHTDDVYCERGKYAAVSCFATVVDPSDYLLSLHFNDVYDYYGDYEYTDYVYDDFNDFYDYPAYEYERLHNQTWGSVSVLYNGLTGRLCSDGWTDANALVACRELGFPQGQMYFHSSIYAEDHLVWSSDFNCTGQESRLADCQHAGWGQITGCANTKAYAGVFCYTNEGVKYRIYNPDPKATSGRVEILLPNTDDWATICHNHWTNNEAKVLCRTLGYATGFTYDVHDLPPATGAVYEREESCQGHESSLDQCVHSGFVRSYSDLCSYHHLDVGVFCTPHAPHEPTTSSTNPPTTILTTTAADNNTTAAAPQPQLAITTSSVNSEPKATTPREPNVATSTEPNETTPREPDATTPTEPNTMTPTEPNAMTPTEPNAMTPTEPDATTLTEPNATTPTEPNATTSTEPNVTTPTKTNATTPTDLKAMKPTELTETTPADPNATTPTLKDQAGQHEAQTLNASSPDYTGTIIGGTVGAILIMVIVGVIFFWRRYRLKNTPEPPTDITNIAYMTHSDQIQLRVQY